MQPLHDRNPGTECDALSVGRYKSGFKRAALQLLGVDTYSCVALHMDVVKPLQGTAAYMQAPHHQETHFHTES